MEERKMNVPMKNQDQLIEELNVMRKKCIDLENEKTKYSEAQKELNQSYKKLHNIMEGVAQIITEVIEIRDPHFTVIKKRFPNLQPL